jgi:hypothetical protein
MAGSCSVHRTHCGILCDFDCTRVPGTEERPGGRVQQFYKLWRVALVGAVTLMYMFNGTFAALDVAVYQRECAHNTQV